MISRVKYGEYKKHDFWLLILIEPINELQLTSYLYALYTLSFFLFHLEF